MLAQEQDFSTAGEREGARGEGARGGAAAAAGQDERCVLSASARNGLWKLRRNERQFSAVLLRVLAEPSAPKTAETISGSRAKERRLNGSYPRANPAR